MKPPSEAAKPHPDEHPELSARNARSGLWLFALYTAVYVAFMLLSAFAVDTMAQPTPLGPNVAILFGFGLIFGAIVLALVYMVLCWRNARAQSSKFETPNPKQIQS